MRGVVLVGHGGIAKDCPAELVSKFKRLEAQRRAAGTSPSAEERELDATIRQWPRTAATDPYRAGLEAVGAALRPLLNGALFALAYNEFCAPSVEESIEDLIRQGATHITVATTMFTRGRPFGDRDSGNTSWRESETSGSLNPIRVAVRHFHDCSNSQRAGTKVHVTVVNG